MEEDISTLQEDVALLTAYATDDAYNLGTTNVTIFAGLADKVPFGQHYVYWRDDQYSYKFAYGDISLSGSSFVGSGSVTICTYAGTTSSGYNTVYTWDISTDGSFSLSAGDMLVYSDLGDYPNLIEREGAKYEAVTSYILFGAVLFYLFDRLRIACFGYKR